MPSPVPNGTSIHTDLYIIVTPTGLLNAIVIREEGEEGGLAWDVCVELKNNGLLAKPTHGNIIRMAPPLCIDEAQINEALGIIEKALRKFM